MGAVRTGKTAKFLEALGHEVRVISAIDQPLAQSLTTEIPEEHVHRTKWINVSKAAEAAVGGRANVVGGGFESRKGGNKLLSKLKVLYKALVGIPDLQIGWYPYAVREGLELGKTWKPDLIFASAGPYTSLLIANKLSQKLHVPWVAEFRDLWTDNPYWDAPKWRLWLDRKIEAKAVATARGFVTVSEPLAEVLRKKFKKESVVVLNGYDPEDVATPSAGMPQGGPLSIIYTGLIIVGKRDPSPLLRAIAKLPPGTVTVNFFGKYLSVVDELAEQFGCGDSVKTHPVISYKESLQKQRDADVLLLLLWDDPSDYGTVTGKVFEYFGSRRPVLVIGPKESVASQLILDRGAGFVTTSEDAILEQLKMWVNQKSADGSLPDLPESASAGLTRRDQAIVLADFLEKVLKTTPTTGSGRS